MGVSPRKLLTCVMVGLLKQDFRMQELVEEQFP